MSRGEALSLQALSTALRDAPVGIGVCNEDGRIIAVNRSLARLLDRTAAEIVGRPFLAFLHPDDRPAGLASYFEAVVAAAAGVRDGRTALRCLTGGRDTVAVDVAWSVTEGDESTGPCGILYLTPAGDRISPAPPSPTADASRPGRPRTTAPADAG